MTPQDRDLYHGKQAKSTYLTRSNKAQRQYHEVCKEATKTEKKFEQMKAKNKYNWMPNNKFKDLQKSLKSLSDFAQLYTITIAHYDIHNMCCMV